jgi:WD repeat-containing protein 42A
MQNETPEDNDNKISYNNLNLINKNYSNMSSDNDEQQDTANNPEETPPPSSSSKSFYKILTPFVPYKNPFIHEGDDDDGEESSNSSSEKDTNTNNTDLLAQRDSKRQKSDFIASTSSKKVYRSKEQQETPVTATVACCSTHTNSNLNDSDSNQDENDDDVDLSSITINPKIKEEIEREQKSHQSVKRKRQESDDQTSVTNPELNINVDSNASISEAMNSSSILDDNDVDEHKKSDEEKREDFSLNPTRSEYWLRAKNPANSFSLNDLINREFGYSGRPGHGNQCSINLFKNLKSESTNKTGCDGGRDVTKLIYDNQFQTPRHFIKRALSGLNFVRRMKLTQSLSYHEGCVNALNFNRLGTMLASGSDDFQVCLWDWSKNNLVLTFDSGHKSNVFQTKFIPFTGDSQIVTCARDGQVRLALISSSGSHIGTKKLAKHADSCHKLAIEYDSCNLFLSCGEDGVVYEIDLRQSTPAKILNVKNLDSSNKLPLYSISSNPSNTYQFVVAGKDQYLRVYDKRMLVDRRDRKILKMLCPTKMRNTASTQRGRSVTSAVYSNDGHEIVASYSDDDIYLFDANQEDDQDAKCSYKGHRNTETIKGVNFYGANSEYIISGSDCGQVFFWEKSTQQIVNVLKGDEHGIVNVLEPHPNFPFLAMSGLDSDVKIWSPTCEEPNGLDNLNEIIKDNQQFRENNRHFSLSSFEFELLLLLMHRPNNRIFFRSRQGDVVRENAVAGDLVNNTESSNHSLDDILSRPFPFANRLIRNFDDEADDEEADGEEDDIDDDGEQAEDTDEEEEDDDDEEEEYPGYFENENNDSNFTAVTSDNLSDFSPLNGHHLSEDVSFSNELNQRINEDSMNSANTIVDDEDAFN